MPSIPKRKLLQRSILYGIYALVGLFVLSLFVVPFLHPDHRVTKIGIVTNVEASGNPYFRDTVYTLTFQDGDVVQVQARNSVPIPVGKPVAIIYSEREKNLLGVMSANPELLKIKK